MSWSWELDRDAEGTFWRTSETDKIYVTLSRFYIFDSKCSSRYVGHSVITVTTEIDPLRCQLYRLVYGSLP